MSKPDGGVYGENELPEDERYESRAEELAAMEKEDSRVEQFLEDQRI